MKPRPAKTEAQMIEWLQTNVWQRGDCLEWAGTCVAGLPVVKWGGQRFYARRLLMKLLGHEIDDKNVYGHRLCDYPQSCMNHEHILIGGHRSAVKAAARRGAYVGGAERAAIVAASRAKDALLPVTERAAVMKMIAAGMTHKQIAKVYGCKRSNVGARLKSWSKMLGGAMFTSPTKGRSMAESA